MRKPDGSPVEAASAWLLSVFDGGGWTEAEAVEAAREAAGVSARALTTARGRLVKDGAIEKRKAGRGAWCYRLAGRVPESEAAPGPEAAGVRAVPEAPEVPERFVATLRVLAGAPMAAAEIHPLAVAMAVGRLVMDCGYSLERLPPLMPLEAPRSPVSAPERARRSRVSVAPQRFR